MLRVLRVDLWPASLANLIQPFPIVPSWIALSTTAHGVITNRLDNGWHSRAAEQTLRPSRPEHGNG
jgi:hypothetical protein